MRVKDVRLRCTGASLLLAVVALFSTIAHAGPGVWTSGGPYGGDVRALAIDPASPTTLYAGTFGGGVFKSIDSGGTWASANSGLTDLAVQALAINPAAPSTLYAGTGGGGIFKSTDSGATWAAANAGLTNADVCALAINPSSPSMLYAGTHDGGVFKSTDSGATWAAANTGLTYPYVVALAINPTLPDTLYAGTPAAGVFKSIDSGGTWTPAGLTVVNALGINPATPSTLYAGTGGNGIYKSTDSGGTWAALNSGPGYVLALVIDPATPATLYAGTKFGSGVFKSTDSGRTWTNTGLTNQTNHPDVYAIAIDPSISSTLYAGTNYGGGVFKSSNAGGTWAAANTGFTNLQVHALAINPTNPSTLYAGMYYYGIDVNAGVFKSTDSGRTWVAANAGLTYRDVNALAIDPSNPATLYAGTIFGGVFKSIDGGGTWATASAGLPTFLSSYATVKVLAINPATPATLYAVPNSGGVYKSADSGGTWAAASSGLGGLGVQTLVINPSTPATLYAGTLGSGVFKSIDAGGTWTAAKMGLTDLNIQALAINPANPGTLYAGTYNGGVFKSTDAGGTWAAANGGLKSLNVQALAINPAIPSTLYAGTRGGGVFKSTDSGGTWAAVNAGLMAGSVNALVLDSTGATTLYVGIGGSLNNVGNEIGGGSVWQSTPPPGGAASIEGFVPIVLDVVGLAHYTSELQLTNLGAIPATVRLSYTSSIGSGTGDVMETIPAGQQVVYPDAISYLRLRGVPIPASANQGGTLLLSALAGGIHATVRTGADTVTPQPTGRSGLAYTDSDPVTSTTATRMFVYGLRTSDADRSNLAVYNMGQDIVSLKITLVSGDDGSSFDLTAATPRVLPAYGWYQYSGVLNAAGFSSGYATIERVTGSGPFGAYGVVNDQMTNDGSFIPAFPESLRGSKFTIPVLVETSAFESELILTNRESDTVTFTLSYLESLSPTKGPGGTATVEVAAGRQRIIPKAIDFLRSKGISIGARGEAGYAGSLLVQVSGAGFAFAGARTSSLSPAGGEFGLFCQGIDPGHEFSEQAFVLGLKADANNRSNVAVLHAGTWSDWSPITLELQVIDGSEGGKAVGLPLSLTLNPGQWAQPAGFFASGGVPNGYVRIRRMAGTAPWYAYGVINDGGQPGQRTGDGSYVPGVQP